MPYRRTPAIPKPKKIVRRKKPLRTANSRGNPPGRGETRRVRDFYGPNRSRSRLASRRGR